MKRRIISAVIAGVMTLGVGSFAYTENQGQPEETERSVAVSEKRRAFVDRTENSDENEKGQRGSGEDKTSEETGEEVTDRRDKQGKEDRKSEKSSERNWGKKTSDRENSSSSSSDSNRPASRPSGNSGNSSSGSSGKPNNTPSSKPNNKPSGVTGSKPNNKPSGESGQTENKPSKPSHTHNWSPQTTVVHHPATGHYEDVLVKDSWTESKPIYETVAIEVCNTCGADITANPREHVKQHMLAGEGGSAHTEYIQKQTGTETITHPAEYETRWVQDSAAWDETVTIGYTCSCGATK